MDFIELGNGEIDDIIKKLPKKNIKYTIIRDDDAAEAGAPAYWAAESDNASAVQKAYELDGGTVSSVIIIGG